MTRATLVQSPEATKFAQDYSLTTFRKVELGDPAKFANVATHITTAHEGVAAALKKLAQIADDPTRSDPEKHDLAKGTAEKLGATLAGSHKAIVVEADRLEAAGMEALAERWAPDPSRAGLQSEMRLWVRDSVKSPDGLAAVKEAVRESAEFASIVYHAPRQLLGMTEGVRNSLWSEGLKVHLPKVAGKFVDAMELMKVAAKYPGFIQRMHRSFYSPAIAELAKKRVTED